MPLKRLVIQEITCNNEVLPDDNNNPTHKCNGASPVEISTEKDSKELENIAIQSEKVLISTENNSSSGKEAERQVNHFLLLFVV